MDSSDCLEYFRKQAKLLRNGVKRGDAGPLKRVERHLGDSGQLNLMKCQHVIAREHEFSSWNDLVIADDIERRLAITMVREPALNYNGIGGHGTYRGRPPEERQQIYQKLRHQLRAHAKDVAITLDWMAKNLAPRKTVNRAGLSSYGLKHLVERDIGYISNGTFIAAAVIARYPYRFDMDSPNADVGVSLRSVKAVKARQRRERKLTV